VPGYANPQSLNRYSYVLNNPLRYTDPSGHWADDGYVGNHGSLDCSKYSQYCNDGKPKSAKELETMRTKPKNHNNGEAGSGNKKTDPVVTALQNIATGLDIVAWSIDLYNAGVVTYGGVVGAGIALPFAGGGPEVPAITGLAGIGLAELSVQPALQLANGIAVISTGFTAAADIRSGKTNLAEGIVGTNTLNSIATTSYGLKLPEAYLSLALQSVAVSNDLSWTSFPFPQRSNR
jgi:hypothetical protein